MPDVEDEDDPGLAAAGILVPNLVVERIVKDEHGALSPGQVPVGHAQPRRTSGRNLESQVSPEPTVGGSGVGVNVGARLHDAELDLAPAIGRHFRYGVDQGARLGRSGARLPVLPALSVQLELSPAADVLQALALADVKPFPEYCQRLSLDLLPVGGDGFQLPLAASFCQLPDGLGLEPFDVVQRPLPETEKDLPVGALGVDSIGVFRSAQPPQSVTQMEKELAVDDVTGLDAPPEKVDPPLQQGRRLPGLGALQLEDETEVGHGEPVVRMTSEDGLENGLGLRVLSGQEMQDSQAVALGDVIDLFDEGLLDLDGSHVPAPEQHQVNAFGSGLLQQADRHVSSRSDDLVQRVDGFLQEEVRPLDLGQRVQGFSLDEQGSGRGAFGQHGVAIGDQGLCSRLLRYSIGGTVFEGVQDVLKLFIVGISDI